MWGVPLLHASAGVNRKCPFAACCCKACHLTVSIWRSWLMYSATLTCSCLQQCAASITCKQAIVNCHLCCVPGAGWHKAGPDQQLPPHVVWNQVSDSERRSLDGSASAENISRGQQRGPARTNSYKLPQGTDLGAALNTCHSTLLSSTTTLCAASQHVVSYSAMGSYLMPDCQEYAVVQLLDQKLCHLAYLQLRLI